MSGFIGHVRIVATWFRSIFVVTIMVDTELAVCICTYLNSRRRGRSAPPHYGCTSWYVKSEFRRRTVVFESCIKSSTLLWLGRAPLWLGVRHSVADPMRARPSDEGERAYSLSFIRGTLSVEALFVTASAHRDNVLQSADYMSYVSSGRHRVVTCHGSSLTGFGDDGSKSLTSRSDSSSYSFNAASGNRLVSHRAEDIGDELRAGLGGIVLSTALQDTVRLIQCWWESRVWSIERRIPWRLGLLLTGAPGTGKTSFARAIAEEYDLPLYHMDIASMSNRDLGSAWSTAVEESPCVILIEDVDAVFDGRRNVATAQGLAASGGLTFDALLQCVDGVERASGVLLFVTSNHPEQLDSALTRSCRLDETVRFEKLDHTGRLRLARMIFCDETRAAVEAGAVDDCTAADFVSRCCRLAREERLRGVVAMVPYR